MARRRGTEQEWRKRLERWPDFDGTVAAFCEGEGANTKAFYVWRKRFAGASQASNAVKGLALLGPPEAEEIFNQLAANDKSLKVRQAAMMALEHTASAAA